MKQNSLKISIFVGNNFYQMFIGLVIILISIFGLGYSLGKRKAKKEYYDRKNYNNIFMNFHNATEYVDHQYQEYLEICETLGKTPMLMDQFKNEVRNNKNLQNELNEYGINLYSGK